MYKQERSQCCGPLCGKMAVPSKSPVIHEASLLMKCDKRWYCNRGSYSKILRKATSTYPICWLYLEYSGTKKGLPSTTMVDQPLASCCLSSTCPLHKFSNLLVFIRTMHNCKGGAYCNMKKCKGHEQWFISLVHQQNHIGLCQSPSNNTQHLVCLKKSNEFGWNFAM